MKKEVEGLVASQGRRTKRAAKKAAPKSIQLLRAIRRVIGQTPPEKIDMRLYLGWDGCGCALYHAEKAGIKVNAGSNRDLGLTRTTFNRLFDCNPESDPAYRYQDGARAKHAFLRRIDALIRKATGE